ncbi:MAG: ECF transporter S component [Desulfurococcales archaeon]|nr:ECF transporter S component [Desulfurococcales archaeon]
MNVRSIVLASVFSALVFTATLISVSTPITKGYFNLGESMVYTAAIIGGPAVGAVAGGLGSSLADIYLGYGDYAPGTLIIKGVEGFLVGLLFKALSRIPRDKWKRYSIILALIAGAGISVAGLILYGGLYGGNTELVLWGKTYKFTIPAPAWVMLGVIVAIVIIYTSFRVESLIAGAVLSMMLGGLEMVAGYFIYEYAILGYGISAAAEIPINIGQALVGTVISVFIISTVYRAGAGIDRG